MIISNCRSNSGWGAYTDNLKYAVGKNVIVLNLFGSTNKGGCTDTPSLVPGESYVKSVVARAIPRFYFHKLITNIESERSNGLVVHYAYNLLPLIGDRELDIVTIHDLIFMSKLYVNIAPIQSIYARLLLKGYLDYTNIITVSDSVKQKLILMGCESNIKVIHPAVLPHFSHIEVSQAEKRDLNLPSDKILILSPSNKMPWKNLEMVSKVMKKLGEKFQLIRVGPSIGTGTTFTNIDPMTLNTLYNASDLLLFPSLEEGFGYPLVEAMKTGLPAVVSDIDVFHEICADAAVYVDPTDVDSITAGIFDALDRKEKLRNLGFRRSELFSLDAFKERIVSYYKHVTH